MQPECKTGQRNVLSEMQVAGLGSSGDPVCSPVRDYWQEVRMIPETACLASLPMSHVSPGSWCWLLAPWSSWLSFSWTITIPALSTTAHALAISVWLGDTRVEAATLLWGGHQKNAASETYLWQMRVLRPWRWSGQWRRWPRPSSCLSSCRWDLWRSLRSPERLAACHPPWLSSACWDCFEEFQTAASIESSSCKV